MFSSAAAVSAYVGAPCVAGLYPARNHPNLTWAVGLECVFLPLTPDYELYDFARNDRVRSYGS